MSLIRDHQAINVRCSELRKATCFKMSQEKGCYIYTQSVVRGGGININMNPDTLKESIISFDHRRSCSSGENSGKGKTIVLVEIH